MADEKISPSGLPIDVVYRPNGGVDYDHDLGDPAKFPFTRGVQATMYRSRFWTMRQYAGFGTAAETNRRFRLLLDAGQTGLSTAFDLPTQMGIDSDSPRALGEVGRVDVAIDTVGNDEAMDVSLSLVADRSRIATIANFDRAPREGVQLLGNGPGADPGQDIRDGARDELARLAAAGELRVVIAGVFPFDRAAEAHRQVGAGHTTGKVVLVP
jgi:hypothetical protein